MMIFGETPRFYKNKVKIFIADNKKLTIVFVVWSAILLAL